MNKGRADVKAPALALTAWFRDNQRSLPWRAAYAVPDLVREPVASEAGPGETGPVPRRDPYGTWISEIMLQQTQVATVMEYYRRWMARFPDVAALARAEEADVLEAWAGLGYYSRARNVLATARMVMAEYGGRFPHARESLLGLKGVGEYTAGAIASLAFDLPEPILDGNIVRVFSRLYGMAFLPDGKANKQAYWDMARAWAGSGHAALVNEGLMELGALICTPKSPACGDCPLSAFCRAYAEDAQDRFPPPRSRKGSVDVGGYAVAAFAGSGKEARVLLYTPRKPERLAGLRTFPVFAAEGLPALREAWKAALPGLSQAALRPKPATVTHSITHHRYRLRIAEARLDAAALKADLPEGYAWARESELDCLLVSSLPRKIRQALG